MSSLSDPTLGLLINVGAKYFGKSDLETLLMQAGLHRYGAVDNNKQELVRSRLLGARKAAGLGDVDATRALLKYVLAFVKDAVFDPENAPDWFDDLRDGLLADGYQLTWAGNDDPWIHSEVHWELLPTDASPLPLAAQITALEAELDRHGYTVALNIYRQAVDGLGHHKYESATVDLRITLEDVVTRLAEDHTGYTRQPGPTPGQPRANQGGFAIQHLIRENHLPEREGGEHLHGLWSMIQPSGHPRVSDAEDARFYMTVITATALRLLRHFSV